MRRAGPALAMLAALAACSAEPVTLDGSSAETFAASAEAARRDLPVADRLAFDAALKAPPGKRFADKEDRVSELARTTYDGMTAAQVVEIARR